MAEQAPNDLTGSILAGRYRILRKLGEGAMGAVYLGEHLKIGRQDAIKVLRDALSADVEAIARFNRGARNVAAIRHPNVCTIYDYSDTGDGMQFLAMQFVPGECLKDVVDREGVLSIERSVGIAVQTADALQAAHDAGIVHRDLKPANIMISPGRAGEDVVTVVDFDIAKGSQEGEQSEVTRLGFVVGTPEYMSPEQLTGDRLDGRSDIYSLGLVLFRMITGSLPFEAETAQDLMIKRLTQEPLRLDQVLPGTRFPVGLQEVLDRSLARKAADRHASAADFAAELRAIVPDAVSPRPGTGSPPRPTSGTGQDAIPATRVARPIGAPSQATPIPPNDGIGGRKYLMYGGVGVAVVAIAILAVFALRGPSPSEPPDLARVGSAVTPPPIGNTEPLGSAEPAEPVPPTTAPSGVVGGGPAGGSTNGAPIGAARSTEPTPAPTPPPPPPASGSAATASVAISIPADQLNPTIWRQFEALGPPDPAPAILRAIRDTADAIWQVAGAPTDDRAMAAYVAGSAWLSLGDPGQCTSWLERAVQLRPDGPGYSTMLANCRRQLP